jgi:hypothetical protein
MLAPVLKRPLRRETSSTSASVPVGHQLEQLRSISGDLRRGRTPAYWCWRLLRWWLGSFPC